MNSSSAGVSVLQSGLSSSALDDLLSDCFAIPTDEYTTQQQIRQHQPDQQQADCYFQRQLNIKRENEAANTAPQFFVAPLALTSAPDAASIISDSTSSPSTRSSHVWQDSSATNSLLSPVSSVLSPPNSNIKSPPVDPLIISPEHETKPLPGEALDSPKRRRGRPRLAEPKTRAADAPATATSSTVAKVQKKSAAARRASTASASGADDAKAPKTTEDKKNRIRARNREAAYKCRQKKQKGIDELQSQEVVVENVNKSLHAEASLLRSEILMLKNMVLQHGGCGFSFIEEYISGAAQNLVSSSMAANATTANAGAAMSNTAVGGDSSMDWDMFDNDKRKSEISALGSDDGFSMLDDASIAHGGRAQSQEFMMA
ncbi:Transcription factor atf1 [Colletotrichum aenigma]|uniref:Transcription factor atf1 n=1 Tax=Colletotrichum aenigma TaxID=1215731 RepID=UPI0018723A87|nr:Transcription factor atf1 [Colletotrichum aenigma]KAF5502135.1 Transcription factor atf1 [Colletotrichum aenigma]